MIHEAYVDVNEEGTEAAAATAVVVARSAARPPVEFAADHPFLLIIRSRDENAILFMGRVANPVD